MTKILSNQVDRLPAGAGLGDLAELIRQATAAGEPVSELRNAVNQCLESVGPSMLLWGDERRFIYNQAFVEFAADSRPGRFGAPLRGSWPRVWELIGENLERVFLTGAAHWLPSLEGVVRRGGVEREIFYTCHLTPVPVGDGDVGGVHVSTLETTRAVQFERRLATLRQLAVDISDRGTLEDLYGRLAATLGRAQQDIPFSLLYLVEPRGRVGHLRASSGLVAAGGAAPETILLDDTGPWPVASAIAKGSPLLVDDVGSHFPDLLAGAVRERPERAFLDYIDLGDRLPSAVNILGVGNRLSLDVDYQAFLFDVFRQLSCNLGLVATARRDQDQVANLRRAMESNRQIGAAIGILMMGHKLTEEQAFSTLSAVSQRSNRKLRDIADEVIRTGSLSSRAGA